MSIYFILLNEFQFQQCGPLLDILLQIIDHDKSLHLLWEKSKPKVSTVCCSQNLQEDSKEFLLNLNTPRNFLDCCLQKVNSSLVTVCCSPLLAGPTGTLLIGQDLQAITVCLLLLTGNLAISLHFFPLKNSNQPTLSVFNLLVGIIMYVFGGHVQKVYDHIFSCAF